MVFVFVLGGFSHVFRFGLITVLKIICLIKKYCEDIFLIISGKVVLYYLAFSIFTCNNK